MARVGKYNLEKKQYIELGKEDGEDIRRRALRRRTNKENKNRARRRADKRSGEGGRGRCVTPRRAVERGLRDG